MEFKWLSMFCLGVAIVFGWIWRFFPVTEIIKEGAGFFSGCFIFMSIVFLGLWSAESLISVLKPMIWKAEKKWVRKFNFRIHWSIGFVLGTAIMVGSVPLGGVIAYLTFDLESLIAGTGGIWQLLFAWAITCSVASIGVALLSLHANIANIKNPENRPFWI